MKSSIIYRRMRKGEEDRIFALVSLVFGEFVAPQYFREGIDEFLKYARPNSLAERSQSDHCVLVAEERGEIVGMIELRDQKHISMLFVDKRVQRRGIGRELIRRALEKMKQKDIKSARLTVNASPNSVSAYKRMGFKIEVPSSSKLAFALFQ